MTRETPRQGEGRATGSSAALETYLAGADPESVPLVTALHAAVLAAHPDLEVAVKYRMLMFALRGDWRHWVCAIDAHPKRGIALRFLFGVLLKDPRRVLRPGSSVLMTWDFGRGDPVDPAAVGTYVSEAVARYPDYRANAREIEATSRAAAATRAKPKARG
jgi:hypothetical protein